VKRLNAVLGRGLPAIPFRVRALWALCSLGIVALAFLVPELRLATAPIYDLKHSSLSPAEMQARDAGIAFVILGFATLLFPSGWHAQSRRRPSVESSWVTVFAWTLFVSFAVLFLVWLCFGFYIVHIHVVYGLYLVAILSPRVAIPSLRPGRVLKAPRSTAAV